MKAGFHYQDNTLAADGVSLEELAERFGTPLYVYSGGLLAENYRRVAGAFAGLDAMVAYSVKSNSNLAVLQLLNQEGAAFDIVSGGELERVKKVGVPGERIIFAGVGKRAAEMEAALRYGVAEFNLESIAEAERLDAVAGGLRRKAAVAIRVNPDVDAKTHAKISTGKKENKFGIAMDQALALARRMGRDLPNLRLVGLHCHIGSQILDTTRHTEAVGVVEAFARRVMEETGAPLETLNFGGGFGIAYREDQKPMDLKPLAKALAPVLKGLGVKLILEPGRSISASAGVLVTRVEYLKPVSGKTFVIVDGSMSELIRPTLYEAHHEVLAVARKRGGKSAVVDIVGPVCESGDYLALGREMRLPGAGELLAVRDAGAYGFVMASNYNTRPRPAEILVVDGNAHVARKRETVKDCMRGELLRD